MAIIKSTLDPASRLTDEERKMIKKAASMPVLYDEDSPELTPEQIEEFKRIVAGRKVASTKNTVSLRLTNGTIEKAKAIGTSYTSVLSNVLENVFNDKEALKRYL